MLAGGWKTARMVAHSQPGPISTATSTGHTQEQRQRARCQQSAAQHDPPVAILRAEPDQKGTRHKGQRNDTVQQRVLWSRLPWPPRPSACPSLPLLVRDRLGLGAGRPLQGQHQVRRHQEHRPFRVLVRLGWAPGSGPGGPAGCALPRRPVHPAPPLPRQPSKGRRSAVLGRSGRRSALEASCWRCAGRQPPSAGAGEGRGASSDDAPVTGSEGRKGSTQAALSASPAGKRHDIGPGVVAVARHAPASRPRPKGW